MESLVNVNTNTDAHTASDVARSWLGSARSYGAMKYLRCKSKQSSTRKRWGEGVRGGVGVLCKLSANRHAQVELIKGESQTVDCGYSLVVKLCVVMHSVSGLC